MTATLRMKHEHRRWYSKGPVVAVVLLSLPISVCSALELSDILEASRVTPPARVAFREERHSPLFEEALVLEGYLEYLDRGVMNKIIEAPFSESFLIEDDKVSLERDGEIRSISLERSRELATIIGAIEAILAGEATRLEALFDYEISGTRADWSIELRPRSRRVARRVSQLRVSGSGDSVERILIDLDDGEYQVMNILPKAPGP